MYQSIASPCRFYCSILNLTSLSNLKLRIMCLLHFTSSGLDSCTSQSARSSWHKSPDDCFLFFLTV